MADEPELTDDKLAYPGAMLRGVEGAFAIGDEFRITNADAPLWTRGVWRIASISGKDAKVEYVRA